MGKKNQDGHSIVEISNYWSLYWTESLPHCNTGYESYFMQRLRYRTGNSTTTKGLKGQYHHDRSRLSTGYGIIVLVYKMNNSDWKLPAHLCSSNGDVTLSCGVLFLRHRSHHRSIDDALISIIVMMEIDGDQ